MKIKKLHILYKNDLLPDIFTRYPSFYVFSKLKYEKQKIEYKNTTNWNLLYIHIPFCLSICDFCNLYKIPFKNRLQVSEYIDKLIIELIEKSKNIKWEISGIWIWWGTPNILDNNETIKLFNTIFENFKFKKEYSFEIDIHPNFITKDKISIYKEYWVDLLSVWIQSFEDTILKSINRGVQNNINILEKLKIINDFNINLHVDFIVGLPNDNYNINFDKINNLFKNINIFSTSINKYENNINTQLYKDWYREENNNLKLQRVWKIETYILNTFWIKREKSFFIKHFFTSRYNVISCWAWAFWYIKDFGVYRNSFYNNYIKWNNEIKLFKFDNFEDKIMYILNNWDIEELSFLYKEQYWSYLYEDFNNFFENLDVKYYKNITDLHIKFLFKSDYIAKFKLIDLYYDKIKQYYE